VGWVILNRLKETSDLPWQDVCHLDIMLAFWLCNCRCFNQRPRRKLKNIHL
jgi:hypothetical protein